MRFPFPPNQSATHLPSVPSETLASDPGVTVAEVDTTGESLPLAAATEAIELPAESIPAAEIPELASEPVGLAAEAFVAEIPQAEVEPQPVQARPRPKRKVIAFPRQPAAEIVHQLADPVLTEQPRILDVPEELEAYPTTPFLDGLQFDPARQTPNLSSEHIELPFRAVNVSRRIYAAMMDCSLVAVAAAFFVLIGHKLVPDLVLTKPVRLTAALVAVLLWAIYQYLLLIYAGRTAGMQFAGIRLSTFKGRRPSLRHRRHRVLGLYLSTASLAMGLLWAFVDVDTLCWHDRMSGTYVTKQE